MLFDIKINKIMPLLFFAILLFILFPKYSYSQPNTLCNDNCIITGSDKDDVLIADFNITTTIEAKKGNDQIQGGQAPDVLKGGNGDDRIKGDILYSSEIGPDVLVGEGGNDILLGISSSDYIFGGPGDDFAVAGTQGGTIDGGKGNDVLYGQSNATSILIGGPGEDIFVCTSGIDIVIDYRSGSFGDTLQETDGECEGIAKDKLKEEKTLENMIIYEE